MNWFRGLDGVQRQTFWTCFLGFALDAMDTHLYSFMLPVLVALWELTRSQAGLLASISLFTSALGGWLAGMLADRIGRVPTLQITILWFASFTALGGLAQNYDQLLLWRGLQGLGFGGEWTAGAVLIAEVVDARVRGRAAGLVQSSWALGWGLAALASTVALSALPETWGWRIMFVIGLPPALLVAMARRSLSESPIFKRASRPSDWRAIFSGPNLGATTRGSLLAVGLHSGYYAIATWLPAFLRIDRHLSVLDTGGYMAVVIIGSGAGYLLGSHLSDWVGRRRTLLLYAAGCLIITIAYTTLAASNAQMLLLGFPLGFFSSGIFSCIGATLSELYPTDIRASGQGFCYNLGRGVAGIAPLLVGSAAPLMGLGLAISVCAFAAYALVIIVVLRLPETSGVQLSPS